MEGKSTITFPVKGEHLFYVGSLKIKYLLYNGNPLEPVIRNGALAVQADRGGALTMAYEYRCDSGRNIACAISDDGITLEGNWYPAAEGLAYYNLSAIVPDSLTAISEAETIETTKTPDGNLFSFSFPHPVGGIHFVASRFIVKKTLFKNIELYSYFLPGDEGLAETYLEYTKKYLELYNGMVGEYPYRRFSVVENLFPFGESMPTFTLLGRDVVKLPFIVKTSLGHEVLHQWLGNLVYVDYKKGNWVEGLTTYLSDHLYEDLEGRGWQYRKQMLIDYQNYVLPENEFPVREFRSRVDSASKSIGYGKCAMVFHMLRKIVGDKSFYKAIKKFVDKNRFRSVSWDDIKAVFEEESGRELNNFFDLWLNEKGLPRITVENIKIKPKGLQSVVSFDIVQEDKIYEFDIPVSVKTDNKETRLTPNVKERKQSFEIELDGNPETLVLDEDYDAFRRLSANETPPVIGKLFGGDKGLVVLAGRDHEAKYSGLVDFFKEKGYEIRKPDEVKDKDTHEANLLILGNENPVVKRLFGKMDIPSSGFSLAVKKNPFNDSKVVGIAVSSSREEVTASLTKLSHYGKYSFVAFEDGRNTEKQIAESERGHVITLGQTVRGIETGKTLKFADIIENISHKKIIYIGEQHDKYEHHLAQFEAVKALFKKDRNIAIGMEMFQRPFQKAVDDYIGGKIDEREFLKSSEYFKRWNFDYNLYKDILRFARDNGIPMIALNMRNEIVEKVSRSGIDSLSEEERKELPESMDLTDNAYRKRLQDAFERHKGLTQKDFNNFFQAQIVWDETMAQSIDESMKSNPGRRMVVIAGAGHLMFGSGIPKRVFRRNSLDYAIILNDQSVEPDIADFLLFPEYEHAPRDRAPKLMTILKEEDGKVSIAGFAEGSISEKAGLKKDDIILAIDDQKIEGMDDIKILLFYKKAGDTVNVKVLRKRFLLGDTELRFDVTL